MISKPLIPKQFGVNIGQESSFSLDWHKYIFRNINHVEMNMFVGAKELGTCAYILLVSHLNVICVQLKHMKSYSVLYSIYLESSLY